MLCLATPLWAVPAAVAMGPEFLVQRNFGVVHGTLSETIYGITGITIMLLCCYSILFFAIYAVYRLTAWPPFLPKENTEDGHSPIASLWLSSAWKGVLAVPSTRWALFFLEKAGSAVLGESIFAGPAWQLSSLLAGALLTSASICVTLHGYVRIDLLVKGGRCLCCGYLRVGSHSRACPECGARGRSHEINPLHMWKPRPATRAFVASALLAMLVWPLVFLYAADQPRGGWTIGQHIASRDALQIRAGVFAVVSKDDQLGIVYFDGRAGPNLYYRSWYWSQAGNANAMNAEQRNEGVLQEPRRTMFKVGPWTLEYSYAAPKVGWVYLDDSAFAVRISSVTPVDGLVSHP